MQKLRQLSIDFHCGDPNGTTDPICRATDCENQCAYFLLFCVRTLAAIDLVEGLVRRSFRALVR